MICFICSCSFIGYGYVSDKGDAYIDSWQRYIKAWFCILFWSTYTTGTVCFIALLNIFTEWILVLDIPTFADHGHQVVEHGLGHLPFTEKQVVTPTGNHLSLHSVLAVYYFDVHIILYSMGNNITLWTGTCMVKKLQ
jgi:hypothetical protein